jgi:hypothetical protein
MTQSLPSKHNRTVNNDSTDITDITKKSFLDLSSTEIEQLVITATTQAKKRMHAQGISTIASVDGQIYEEHPDGTRTLRHG